MHADYLFYLVGVACYSIAGYANFVGFSNLSSVFMPVIFGFVAIGVGYSLKKERRAEEKEIIRDVVIIRCKKCAGLVPEKSAYCPNCGVRVDSSFTVKKTVT